jgi:hypothetical protein
MNVSCGMTGNKVSSNYQNPFETNKRFRFQRDIPKAQETIYEYLIEIVKEWTPDDVLDEFKHLFIHHNNTISSATLPCLYEIVLSNQEQEFRNTLKRSCYILINNWDISRNHKSIQQLIQLFSDPILYRNTVSPSLQRLRSWIRAFIDSKDFQELKLFASRYDRDPMHWSDRYTSYLLVPQYIDLNNPLEQRQAARALSRQLKEKFKFELAMYTARSQSVLTQDKLLKNPTGLGEDVLRLIKTIVAKRGLFSYTNFANIFLNQTRNLIYKDFKQSFQKYLIFSVKEHEFTNALKAQLSDKLNSLYTNYDDKQINDALLLRTCNRVIEHLTTENHQEPSPLFVALLTQGHSLTLAIVLLKIILICKNVHTHMEARIADLIKYYEALPEEECQWVINFFELFRITMAIYAENIEFSLVHMHNHYSDAQFSNPELNANPAAKLDDYRIFSQPKATDIPNVEEMAAQELLEVLEEELEEKSIN